jgi:hypothetical protein
MAWMAWGGTILSMNFGFDDFDDSDGGDNDGQKPIGCYCGAKEFVSVLLCCEGLGYIYIFFFLRRELKGFRTSPRMIGRDDTSVRKQIGRPKALKINGWMGQFCRKV